MNRSPHAPDPPESPAIHPRALLFEPDNRAILEKTGAGRLGNPRRPWIIVFLAAIAPLLPWVLSPSGTWTWEWVPPVLGPLLLLATLPKLLSFTWYRIRLWRSGQLLGGTMLCRRVREGPGDNLELLLAYAFRTPPGEVIEGTFRCWLPGSLADGPRYAAWPSPGEQVPIAILYAGPKLFHIL